MRGAKDAWPLFHAAAMARAGHAGFLRRRVSGSGRGEASARSKSKILIERTVTSSRRQTGALTPGRRGPPGHPPGRAAPTGCRRRALFRSSSPGRCPDVAGELDRVAGELSAADQQRLEDRELGEEVGVLEGPGDAESAIWSGRCRCQVALCAPVIMAARSSGCRKEGGGGGPQEYRPCAPWRSSGVHSWSSMMQSMSL
jgi:hypothetical protein